MVRTVVSTRPKRESKFSRLHDIEYDSIVERIARREPGHLLDWGCGYGHHTARLVERGLDVTAFEYFVDKEEDDLGHNRFYPSLEVVVSDDPRELPFEDGSFDSVLSLGVLEHVEDPDTSLSEIHRVLRPGGAFHIFKLPNRFSYVEKLAKWTGQPYHGGGRWIGRVYSKRSATTLLESHGFAVQGFWRANMLPLNRLSIAGKERAVWRLNRALATPPLAFLCTDLEFLAVKH